MLRTDAANPGFRRLALVEVEAAAVGKHEIEIVVAAEDVAPRQPVEHLRRTRRHDGHRGGDLRLVDA